MIHKRFNHTRHLLWAAALLTLFISSAATHRQKMPGNLQPEMAIEKMVSINTVVVK